MRSLSGLPLAVRKKQFAAGVFSPLLFLRWLLAVLLFAAVAPAKAQNPIVTENSLAGNPATEWDITGIGDASIQGFATEISVNKGDRVRFKIRTDAAAYTIAVYRLGYYQGNGARRVGTGTVSATLPQTQPADLYDSTTGLIDCGNWSESGYWDVPTTAVSGVYIARLTRTDNGGASHIAFIVRDDASTSDLYFKTSDGTWQAYNEYGDRSLYPPLNNPNGPRGPIAGHAAKVSYNRPFYTRVLYQGANWLFNAEYPMIRWLERNGYNVSYTTDVDMDRRGSLITRHKALLCVGHDEYWSAGAVNNVTAARNAGVHLAFFDGNSVYWKTRYEPSVDGTATPYRTLVCYKEGTEGEATCGGKCDPLPNVWTGLWSSGCDYPQADGCLPENALTGQLGWIDVTSSIQVTDAYKGLRFWRNTSIASLLPGQVATLTNGTLGGEWAWERVSNTYPKGRITMSSTTINGLTHKLSLYRHSSGAWVFGAGTINWSWGLDGVHDRGSSVPDVRMQQATVNLFADMGVQPAALQSGLLAATASTDRQAPVSVFAPNINTLALAVGVPTVISGTATDVGGAVAGVEVSVDGGATWQAANGTANWSFSWTPTVAGPVTFRCRAFDDNGNMESTATQASSTIITLNVLPFICPCSIFRPTELPTYPRGNDGQSLEFGVRFRSSQNGTINAVRFYKGAGTTGTHIGNLWTNTGTLLARATFVNETASGWQEVQLSNPVAITAGTTYVASVFSSSGDYAATYPFFSQPYSNGPLTALATGTDGANGVYLYTPVSAFPVSNITSTNYWVDVNFNLAPNIDATAPTVTSTLPVNNASGISTTGSVSITFSEPLNPATVNTSTIELRTPSNTLVASTVTYNAATSVATLKPLATLNQATQYTVVVKGGLLDPRIKDTVGNALASDYVFSFTTALPALPSINTQPASQSVCAGSTVMFSSAATGTPAPTVQWQQSTDGGATWTNITGATSGTFVTVAAATDNQKRFRAVWTNTGGSIGSSAAILTVYPLVDANVSSKANTSCGTNNGAVTLTQTGGLSPYTYSLNGGAPQSTPTFNNLGASTYTVIVRDSRGCADTVPGIVIAPSTGVTVSVSSRTNATCGSTNGALTVTGSGGTPAYQYNLNNGTYGVSATFNGLAAGTYTVGIKDAAGCVGTLSGVVIAQVSPVVATVTAKINSTCGTPNGSITLSSAGGLSPYTYSLNGGSYQTGNSFGGLAPGTYTVYAKDAKGCLDTVAGIVIASSSGVSVSVSSKTNVTCGSSNGSITAVGSGGTAPYQYNLNNGTYGTPASFTGLAAGTYTVGVKDAAGCVATLSGVVLSQVSPVVATVSAKTNTTCGSANGAITMSSTGGLSPYTYSLNGVNYQTSNAFSGLAAGTYAVYSKDAKGCLDTVAGIVIAASTGVSVSVSSKTNATCGSTNGAFTVAGSGGTAPYQYNLNNGTYRTSGSFTGLAAGTYTVGIKDAAGCVATLSGIVVSQVSPVVATVSSKTNATCGSADGAITMTATGGLAPYTYSLNGGAYQTGNTFGSLAGGTYTVYAKDAKGCLDTVSGIVVAEVQTIVTNLWFKRNANCNDDNGYFYVYATDGYSPYSYRLDNGAFQTSGFFANLTAGTYRVFVKDSKNCLDTLAGIVISSIGCTTAAQANPILTSEESKKPSAFDVLIYPTASTNEFTAVVQAPQETFDIRVVDVAGRVVYLAKGNANRPYRFGAGLTKGVYVVEISQGQNKKVTKIIKQ